MTTIDCGQVTYETAEPAREFVDRAVSVLTVPKFVQITEKRALDEGFVYIAVAQIVSVYE